MPRNYDWVTQQMFDDKLEELVEEMGANGMRVQVPGVDELVREHLNNDVLQALEDERDEPEEADEEE